MAKFDDAVNYFTECAQLEVDGTIGLYNGGWDFVTPSEDEKYELESLASNIEDFAEKEFSDFPDDYQVSAEDCSSEMIAACEEYQTLYNKLSDRCKDEA